MMVITEDHIALAAEYALGTLDADERAQIELTMAANRSFAALIVSWQLRLAVLHQMVDPVEPSPAVWEKIRIAAGLAAVPAAPAVRASVASAASAPVAAPVVIAPAPDLHGHDRSAFIGTVEPAVQPVVESVVPPAPVHEATKPAVTAAPKPAAAKPPAALELVHEAEPPPELPSPPPSNSGSQLSPESMRVVRFAWQARRWKWTATGTSAIAASLLVIIVAQLYRPELLPNALRPAIRTQVVRVVTPPPPIQAQYVALLQKDATSPAFILTVDAGSKKFTVRRVGAVDEPGRSYELWLVSDKLQRPRSLGVIGERDFTTRAALASFDDDTMHEATYAVTVEPEGGSPTGIATGPVVFTGKLMETVPQGTTSK